MRQCLSQIIVFADLHIRCLLVDMQMHKLRFTFFLGQHRPEHFGTICWTDSAVECTETKCTVYCLVSPWGPLTLNTLLLSPLSSCSCCLSQRVKRWRWASTTPLQMSWTLSTTPWGSKVGKSPFECVCGSAFDWERDKVHTPANVVYSLFHVWSSE